MPNFSQVMGPRAPLRDITQMMSMPEVIQHHSSLSCLIKCTDWSIDIEDVSDELNPLPIISLVSDDYS